MRTFLIGCCHAYGSLLTNASLGLTSASLTLMIKMLEPLVTSVLMMLSGKINFSLSLLAISLTIILTTLESVVSLSTPFSVIGVVLALVSNVCFALRKRVN